jgi:hypothetical protein
MNEQDAQQYGVRILTVFIYLNDVEDGGGTSFPNLSVVDSGENHINTTATSTVIPKRGRVVIWPSVLDEDATQIDWSTEHEAKTVIKGEKYGANVWFHLKPYRKAYSEYVCCLEGQIRGYNPSGPLALAPKELNTLFENIVHDPTNKENYNVQILSSPQTNNDDEADDGGGPWVVTLDEFITPTEAERLIELGAKEGYEQSTITDVGDEVTDEDEYRTSSQSWCREECSKDEIAANVLQRIYDLIQVDEDYTEMMQLLKYETGEL